MNAADSGTASAISLASSVQESHVNPYGDQAQAFRHGDKAPITEKLNNSIQSVARWTWRVVAGSAIVACLGSLFLAQSTTPITGSDATTWSITIFALNIVAGTLVGIGLICGVIFSFVVKKQTQQIERMKAGHYMTRWDLERDQWNSYIEQEKEKANDLVSTAAIVCVFLGLILWFPFSGVLGVMTCILCIVGLGLVGYVLGMLIAAVRKSRLERMSGSPQFTVIGHDGLYFQNAYHAYSTFGSGLSHIEKVKTGTMEYLVFTFFNQTNNGRTEHEKRVPVPRGREEEASWVLKQLG